eukprot:TRINITY_DN5938_c0_g1_i1.p1 TRINITY_DN5938_c0_g1~~TRINITY_DN5938_c0_g1_i1.p1  ORF type:complete len:436 (-),score=81.02 TRINITY_DN5938_c0_g1_i1:137-1444(-)
MMLDMGASGDADGTGSFPATPPARAKSPLKTATPAAKATRMPRDGIRGGGRCVANNPVLLEAVLQEVAQCELGLTPDGSQSGKMAKKKLGRLRERRPSSATRSVTQLEGAETPKSMSPEKVVPQTTTQEERRRAEIYAKWDKIEELRARDQKMILERVERGKEARDGRFDRLVEAVTGRDNLAYKTAMALRERENHEDRRRQEFHAAWEQRVYKPLSDQAHRHMNPPDRGIMQKMTGNKGVEFRLPSNSRRLIANVCEDPVRKPSVDHAQENAFHHVANVVLHGSLSAPHLYDHCLPPPATGAGGVMPRARTRPVLEPTNWSQHGIKGTMFGHFAQVCEYGPGFKRAMRGGTNVHIPDTSDMVLTAGSRVGRATGHGDVGILRGDTAAQGESSNFKVAHGPSCAAPMQDHFTFETGPRVTELEFPLGKRIFPEFH